MKIFGISSRSSLPKKIDSELTKQTNTQQENA